MPIPVAPVGLTERELELRQDFVGASESAALLGVSPYMSAGDLYARKVGMVPPEPDNQMMRLGRLYEPLILRFVAEDRGVTLTRKNRRRVHPTVPMQATIDAFVVGERIIVEAKKVSYRTYLKDKQQWDGPEDDAVPLAYLVQVQHQLHALTKATGEPWDLAFLGVCIGDEDFRCYEIRREPALGERIEQAIAHFMCDHVALGVPPEDADFSLEVLSRMPRQEGIALKLDPRPFHDYLKAHEDEKAAGERKDAAKKRLLELLGPENNQGIATDGSRVTYFPATARRLNQKLLEQDHPDLVARYKTATAHPRISVKTPKATE